MHRRDILKLVAVGAVIPSVALAQRRDDRVSEAVERYIEDTLAIGGIALSTSQLARERARSRWVKKFAEYETEEQEGVSSILKSLGARPPAEAREEKREARNDLRELSGERFEEAYLEAQAEGHERLLRVQNDFIKTGRDEDLQPIAKLIRGRVQEHIDLIRTIRDQLRT